MKSKENLFNEITGENSPNVEREMDEPFQTSKRHDQRRTSPWRNAQHVINTSKEIILEAMQEKVLTH